MPTTDRSGVAIHYETTGCGRPLVLLHGMMGRLEVWRMEGYVDALRRDHRLILIDARGHGLSERPLEREAYRIACHAADVLAVLDELEIEKAALSGWSMGAAAALRIAATDPHRVEAVAALGPRYGVDCVGFADVPVPEVRDDGPARQFEREGMAPLVRKLEQDGHPRWARLIGQADPTAMAACWRGYCQVDPVAARLADLETPLLFVWGEMEAPSRPLPLPRPARVLVLPEEDHLGAFRHSEIIAPEIRRLVAAAAVQRSAVGLAEALPY